MAVKVQYPGVGEAIEADLANAELLGTMLAQGFGGLDPARWSPRSRPRITEELDYALEADNQQAFADFYRGHPFIHVPAVLPTLLDAPGADHRAGVGAPWARAARPGTRTSATSPARRSSASCSAASTGCHAFNGDPHPGNYLFHPGGQVTFLDFGLVKHFSDDRAVDVRARWSRAAAVDHDAAAFRRDRRGRRPAAPRRAGRRPRRSATTSPTSTSPCATTDADDLDPRVRQPRSCATRSTAPARSPSTPTVPPGVRVHPAHQPRAVRACSASSARPATTGASPRSCGRSRAPSVDRLGRAEADWLAGRAASESLWLSPPAT